MNARKNSRFMGDTVADPNGIAIAIGIAIAFAIERPDEEGNTAMLRDDYSARTLFNAEAKLYRIAVYLLIRQSVNPLGRIAA